MRIWLDKTVDEEFEDLGTQGHTGTLNDRQFTFLATLGHSGALADRMGSFIAGGRVVGDVTAPVISGNSFNDTTDAATFTTDEGGTFVWATHLTTETLTANGSGGWTGSLLESGTDTVASSGESTISAAYTATTGTGGESRKFSYYVRDAAGNDSNVITEAFTVNSVGYTANAVDNTGAVYGYSNSFSGPAAGKTGTMSFWFNLQGTWPAAAGYLVQAKAAGGNERIFVKTASSGRLNISMQNSSSTAILQRLTNTSVFTAGVWYHVLLSWDLATTTAEIYVNDVRLTTFGLSTTIDDNVDAIGRFSLFDQTTSGAISDSFMSEVYIDTNYIDLTTEANRRNFIDASGKPVDLTSYAASNTPWAYFKGDYTNFFTNSGSGGNITETGGSLIAAASSPSD